MLGIEPELKKTTTRQQKKAATAEEEGNYTGEE